MFVFMNSSISISNSLAFQFPLLTSPTPSLLAQLPLRCTAHPPQHQNTTTRRAFLARIFTTFLLIATPTNAQQIPHPSPTSTSPSPPQPNTQSQQQQPPPSTPTRRPTWGYSPEDGPHAWAHLSEDWSIAATGTSQSPISLSYRTATTSADTPRPTLATNPAKFSVRLRNLPSAVNPSLCLEPYIPPPPPLVGDAPPVDTYTPPPIPALVTLPASSSTYALRSVYMHIAAEHVLEGTTAPLELHFVFDKVLRKPPSATLPTQYPSAPSVVDEQQDSPVPAASSPTLSTSSPLFTTSAQAADESTETSDVSNTDGPAKTLVVAMLASTSEQTAPWLSSLLQDFITAAGEDGKGPGIVLDLDMALVLPPFDQSDLYMYSGSLTTPPCTEGVQWLVLSSRLPVKQSDVEKLLVMQGGRNARPLQDLNGRRVIRFPAVAPTT